MIDLNSSGMFAVSSILHVNGNESISDNGIIFIANCSYMIFMTQASRAGHFHLSYKAPLTLSVVYGLVLTEMKLNLYAAASCYHRSFSQSLPSFQSIFQEKDLDF